MSEIEFYKLRKTLYIQQGNNIDSSLFAYFMRQQQKKTPDIGISNANIKMRKKRFHPSTFTAIVVL